MKDIFLISKKSYISRNNFQCQSEIKQMNKKDKNNKKIFLAGSWMCAGKLLYGSSLSKVMRLSW